MEDQIFVQLSQHLTRQTVLPAEVVERKPLGPEPPQVLQRNDQDVVDPTAGVEQGRDWTERVVEEMNVAVVDDAALVVVAVQCSEMRVMVLVDSLWYQDGHKAAHPGLLTQPLADCPSTYAERKDPQVHTSVAFEGVHVDGSL